jgi:hypothetical protein
MSDRERRVAENEQRFRVFNEGVREVGEQLHAEPRFTCECGDVTCTQPIEITVEDYQHARRDPRCFAVLPGHELPDVERVVERHDTHLVVQKTGEGAEVVQ